MIVNCIKNLLRGLTLVKSWNRRITGLYDKIELYEIKDEPNDEIVQKGWC
jgi:hypothetical protein